MHWYCLFIDEKPAAGWHRHRRQAVRDALVTGAAAIEPSRGKRLVWEPSAHIHVCDSAADRDRWIKSRNEPPILA